MNRKLLILCVLLLLILGASFYLLWRPHVFAVHFLNFLIPLHQVSSRSPFTGSGAWIRFAVNHGADILWYSSLLLLLMATLDRDRLNPAQWALVGLPFLLEFLQGLKWIPGTFDWLDLFYYLITLIVFLFLFPTFKNAVMKKHSAKKWLPAFLVLAFTLLALGSAPNKVSYTTGTLRFAPKQDDIFTKNSLKDYLHSTPNPTIVLRVPAQVDEVVVQKNYSNSQIYDIIEEELAKANFIVRDRALFQKVLDQSQAVDYSKIKQLTDTDLILELVSFQQVDYVTNQYMDRKDRSRIYPVNLKVPGYRVEFRLIQVKTNDLVGTYTFNYAPCTEGCLYTFDTMGNLFKPESKNQRMTPLNGILLTPQDQLERFIRTCTLDLIREMRTSS